MSKVFPMNYQFLYEIDTTPSGASRTWARLAAGLTGADPSNNEDKDQTAYLDGDGYKSSDIIGAQYTVGFSGHRVLGDTAQDYIASLEHEIGDNRKTNFRITDKDGNQKTGAVTIADVDFGGGDAGAKVEIAFSLDFNGKPTLTPKSTAAALSAVIAPGSVSGTTKFTATPGAGNSLKYKLGSSSVGTVYGNALLENAIAYTSAANIVAVIGQVLSMYEVDAYGRVVKFLEDTLIADDIMA